VITAKAGGDVKAAMARSSTAQTITGTSGQISLRERRRNESGSFPATTIRSNGWPPYFCRYSSRRYGS